MGVLDGKKEGAQLGTTHGGRREGAGRKKTNVRRGGAHRLRPALLPQHPVHVTLRIRRWLPDLRAGRFYRALRPVLARYLGRDDFRIVHLSIQNNHLHLLVEAADREALTRNMQSFEINAARAINRVRGSSGKEEGRADVRYAKFVKRVPCSREPIRVRSSPLDLLRGGRIAP